MSDNEETVSDRGYDTPVPELDDHRNHGLSVSRPERPRRGTFDTFYGTRRLEPEESATEQNHGIRVRDFEEVIDEDEDAPETSVNARRSRRPTVDSLSEQRVRAVSPPNSVKAFAEARRREREMSFSEAGPALKPGDDDELRRTVSITSRRSRRSRPMTVDDEAASVVSSKSAAEEDVCFPLQEEHRKDKLYIDFDYLENFILAEEAEAHRQAELAAETRAFPDLREDAAPAPPAPPMITVDGDFVDMPSDASVREEKEEPAPAGKEVKPSPATSDINRFSFFSSAWESTIHAPNLGGLVLPGENIRGLFTPPVNDPDGVWWLNMNSPTEEEVRAICKAFGIHPLTVEDILTQEAREKIELFNAYYFACFRSFNIVEDASGPEYEPFHIYVVVFREGILTFSFEPNSHAAHVRRRIALLKDYMALSSDWICYAVIDDIVDSFAPVIKKIEAETDSIEDEVFIARTDDMHGFLRKIGLVRKNVMALMRLLGGKADVLKGFTKRCNENYKVTPGMGVGLYLGDIQDHVVTMMTNLGHFEKMLSRSHSNYLAQLSIDSISQGTDTNKVLSKITFLASILVPLNLVCGLFGMNVTVPFGNVDNLNAFFVILGSLVLFTIVTVLWARRKNYI